RNGPVLLDVADAESTAHVENARQIAEALPRLLRQSRHLSDGQPVAAGSKDLRTDVAVKALQNQMAGLERLLHRPDRLASRQAKPESRIFLAGLDVLMGAHFHPRRHPEQNSRALPLFPGQTVQHLQFGEIV